MNPCITNFFTLALIGLQLFSSVALGASNRDLEHANQLRNNEDGGAAHLKTCIDDSDCAKQGSGLRCFLYICYPWMDDSAVPAKERRTSCRRDNPCRKPNQECVHHNDIRHVSTGLCFGKVQKCSTPKECSNGNGCCSGYCCEPHYFNEYRKLPCSNHAMCQDLGLGNFCCPNDNTNSTICCDTDPNPKPTQAPSVGKTNGVSAVPVASNNVKMLFGLTFLSSYLLSKMI